MKYLKQALVQGIKDQHSDRLYSYGLKGFEVLYIPLLLSRPMGV